MSSIKFLLLMFITDIYHLFHILQIVIAKNE